MMKNNTIDRYTDGLIFLYDPCNDINFFQKELHSEVVYDQSSSAYILKKCKTHPSTLVSFGSSVEYCRLVTPVSRLHHKLRVPKTADYLCGVNLKNFYIEYKGQNVGNFTWDCHLRIPLKVISDLYIVSFDEIPECGVPICMRTLNPRFDKSHEKFEYEDIEGRSFKYMDSEIFERY